MDRYRWKLKDGCEAELSFSAHFDNIIDKYRNNRCIEHAFLMDGAIVNALPFILRYCFEEGIELRKRKFLRNLPCKGGYTLDQMALDYRKQDFQIPLRIEGCRVNSVDGKLVINSSGEGPGGKIQGKVSFDSRDVSGIVEGILRVLKKDGNIAQAKCAEIVRYYYNCLDGGLLK